MDIFNNISNKEIFACIVVVIVFLIYKVVLLENKIKNISIENMANIVGIDPVAISNMASMLNAGKMKVTNLHITGSLKCDGKITSGNDISSTGNVTVGEKLSVTGPVTFKNTLVNNGTITSNGLITANGSMVLTKGAKKYYMGTDATGRLQMGPSPTNPMVSLPNGEKDTPVFRASGIMYTNKDNILSTSARDDNNHRAYKTKVWNHMANDKDKHKNIMFFGGTDGYDSHHHVVFGNVRHHNGMWQAHTPSWHGHSYQCKVNHGCTWHNNAKVP